MKQALQFNHFTPVFMGTAFKNKGVQPLLDAVVRLLPSPADCQPKALEFQPPHREIDLSPDPEKPTVAMAFKIVENSFGALTFMRVYQGTIVKGESYFNQRTGQKCRFSRIVRMHADERHEIESAGPGDIVAVVGVECASGDTFCTDKDFVTLQNMFVPEPVISVAIAPVKREGADRLAKALSMMKAGDYLIAEFGHNDQKQRGPGMGAYYNFATALKTFIDEARARGATPIFVTPTQRRTFKDGSIQETHADYPEAMAWVATRENVPLIDLHEMTRTFYEAMGEEQSKRAFVHYPAGSFPGQTAEFKDNTHFNPYGAYEIAKCVIEGMKAIQLPIIQYLRPEYKPFEPAHPDSFEDFHWNDSPFFEAEKPDGN